jgi:hypothetical protein
MAMLFFGPAGISARGEADLATALDRLKAVGPMGAGNAAAQDAWLQVVAAGPDQLCTVLAAFEGSNPLAENWLRGAADAIAERALANGNGLPAQDLEAFILDQSHAPRARRVAFEWLARVDPSAPDRLIPRFLNDANLEFRREAVERLRVLARQRAEAGEETAAAALLEEAFNAARDEDQIEALAQELEKRGKQVDLVRHYGFICVWRLIAPFDNTDQRAFDVEYPPEKELAFSARYTGKAGAEAAWFEHATEDPHGLVDLNKAIGPVKGAVAYACAEFHAAEPREAELRLSTVNAVKLWLNGEPLLEKEVYHSGTALDQYVAPARLRRGRNVILLKICQNEQTEPWAQDWSFRLRVCDKVGTAVLPSNP